LSPSRQRRLFFHANRNSHLPQLLPADEMARVIEKFRGYGQQA
jgi:hypothetical protein